MGVRSRHGDVLACPPVNSDRRLATDVTPRITWPGNQQIHGRPIEAVLKTGPPEDIVVRDHTEQFCDLQSYFRADRHKIRGSEQSDPALAEIIACREEWI